ncbi:hypothetical protein JIN84_05255 [Luteolibacter yonseiensis]|uniref:Uncharacterized protein n=1 Tax=Luteolibacter yonseiensis TaxID=1144680 RepID=A0A934R2C7_9BACT|nr:hypothetical protein [Luteolibacter yonseiensis]MBK1815011.1 hypothetical protein [Luteolibacter yonseiensis]
MKIHSLLAGVLATTILHAQEKPADPFRENNTGENVAPEKSGPTNISICWETFSLPMATAAQLQREQLPDFELYARLVSAVEKQTARQEAFTLLRAKSGQKAVSESISEDIYPTEYEPPVDSDPATPVAFETRNAGMTLEIEPILGKEDKILDLRLAPEVVTQVRRSAWGQGTATTQMPVFETQRTNTTAILRMDQPYLVSTINRPPNSEADPDAANRVWFAFVTATLAKP